MIIYSSGTCRCGTPVLLSAEHSVNNISKLLDLCIVKYLLIYSMFGGTPYLSMSSHHDQTGTLTEDSLDMEGGFPPMVTADTSSPVLSSMVWPAAPPSPTSMDAAWRSPGCEHVQPLLVILHHLPPLLPRP